MCCHSFVLPWQRQHWHQGKLLKQAVGHIALMDAVLSGAEKNCLIALSSVVSFGLGSCSVAFTRSFAASMLSCGLVAQF